MIERCCKVAKKAKIITRIDSGIVSEKPCKVYTIYVSPDYGTAVECKVFNGTNENVEEKLEVNASAIGSDYICPSLPWLFDKGVYIVSDDADAKFTFQVKELY